MILRNDYYQVSEDVSLRMDILGNDQVGFDHNLMEISVIQGPVNGTIKMGFQSELLFTPTPNFYGFDSLQYQVCNPGGFCKYAWVKIYVHPVNDPPIAGEDIDTLWEDQSLHLDILANDSDAADGNFLQGDQISILEYPGHGRLQLDEIGMVHYQPDTNYNGNDMFRYKLCDSAPDEELCDSTTVRLFIRSVNAAPLLRPDTFATYPAFPVVIDVLKNDSDGDDQVATLDTSTLQVHDLMEGMTNKASIYVDYSVGLIIFTPPSGFLGNYTFHYKDCDRDKELPLFDTTHVIIEVLDELPTFH